MPHYVLCAFLIGVIAGLRSLTAPAAVSWAAALRWMHLESTPLAFLGYAATPYVFSVLAAGELVADKLPSTPSRKAALGFGARIAMGALCGGAFGAAFGSLAAGAASGVAGALVGTLGGYEARVRLSRRAGRDLPIALIEDIIAIGGAIFLISRT
jgi:uncharacterized membrane protein